MVDRRDAMNKGGRTPGNDKKFGNRGNGGRNNSARGHVQKLPDSYFENDEQGRKYLHPVFVSKKTIDPLARLLGQDARPNLTTGQMRRFFNECREIERLVEVDGESWERVSARFEGLCYHAQNAVWKHKIPREFQEFIDDNVRRVVIAAEPRETFLYGFLPHFEALVGFGAAYMRRDS